MTRSSLQKCEIVLSPLNLFFSITLSLFLFHSVSLSHSFIFTRFLSLPLTFLCPKHSFFHFLSLSLSHSVSLSLLFLIFIYFFLKIVRFAGALAVYDKEEVSEVNSDLYQIILMPVISHWHIYYCSLSQSLAFSCTVALFCSLSIYLFILLSFSLSLSAFLPFCVLGFSFSCQSNHRLYQQTFRACRCQRILGQSGLQSDSWYSLHHGCMYGHSVTELHRSEDIIWREEDLYHNLHYLHPGYILSISVHY